MTNLIEFNTFDEFLRYNEIFVKNEYYPHYYLIRIIDQILNGHIGIYRCYNIIGDEDRRIICVHIEGGYLLYGANWNDDMLNLLSSQVDLKVCTVNFSFSGNKLLIISLFRKQNAPYEVFKERLVYECKSLNDVLIDIEGSLELCTFDDLKKLSDLAYMYHLDEYGGKGFHSFDLIKKRVKDGIKTKSYYLFRDGKKICCMAQVFNKESGYPLIGGLVTDRTLRGRGYATAFLYDLTDMIMDEGFDKCGLVSDATNLASNKVFQRVGYVPVYEYISMHTLIPSKFD